MSTDEFRLKDQIDLTTSSGRLLMQIIGAMSEFEAALIKERVKAGLNNAKAKGKKLGRPKADCSHIIAMKSSGLSNRAIAEKLGVSRDTVERAFRNKPHQSAPQKA